MARNGDIFHAHLSILGIYTDLFEKALQEGFSEAETKTVRLADHPSKAIMQMLEFCYSGKLDTMVYLEAINDLYTLADYVMMKDPKTAAVIEVEGEFRYRLDQDERVAWWRGVLTSAVRWIYDKTSDGTTHVDIRRAYAEGCKSGIYAGLDAKLLEELIEDDGDFAKDMFNALVEHGKTMAKSKSGKSDLTR